MNTTTPQAFVREGQRTNEEVSRQVHQNPFSIRILRARLHRACGAEYMPAHQGCRLYCTAAHAPFVLLVNGTFCLPPLLSHHSYTSLRKKAYRDSTNYSKGRSAPCSGTIPRLSESPGLCTKTRQSLKTIPRCGQLPQPQLTANQSTQNNSKHARDPEHASPHHDGRYISRGWGYQRLQLHVRTALIIVS